MPLDTGKSGSVEEIAFPCSRNRACCGLFSTIVFMVWRTKCEQRRTRMYSTEEPNCRHQGVGYWQLAASYPRLSQPMIHHSLPTCPYGACTTYLAACSSWHYLHPRAPLNNSYVIDNKELTRVSGNPCRASSQGISMFILDPTDSLAAQTKTLEEV
jgi:hypothetical protein